MLKTPYSLFLGDAPDASPSLELLCDTTRVLARFVSPDCRVVGISVDTLASV